MLVLGDCSDNIAVQKKQTKTVKTGKAHKLIKKLKDLPKKEFNNFVDFLFDYAVIAEGGSPKNPSKYLRQLDKYLSAKS